MPLLPPGLKARLHPFRPRLLDTLPGYDRGRFLADLGAGVTVGVVALPLAMAFAIASGVAPEAGLVTAIIAGFLISALGGSNVQIGGPAGAFIVIVYAIVERYGLANLLISTVLAGLLLFTMGLFKLGGLVRFVPVPIIIGFTNGIAVLIALSQLKDLLGLDTGKMPADFFSQLGVLGGALPSLNLAALGLGLASLALVVLWPKSDDTAPDATDATDATAATGGWVRLRKLAARVPGTVIALVLATLAALLLNLPVDTIGSRFGSIPQGLPAFALPEFSWATAKQLLIPTVTIALLGAVESLLCARVADNMADNMANHMAGRTAPAAASAAGTKAERAGPAYARHDPNQELMAQGVANVVAPLFGGIPATGTIARTVTNVRAGGLTPVSGMVHAATLLLVLLVAAPLALHIPLAALAGILMFVAWNMGEWREFSRLRRFSLPYRTTLLGTFALTVIFDLTVAVEVGLLLACGFFIFRMAQMFRVRPLPPAQLPAGVLGYELFGPLFFGAVDKLESLAAQAPQGTRGVVLDLHRMIFMDNSGLEALEQLHRALHRQGIRLVLAAVTEQPLQLLQRAGLDLALGEGQLTTDLDQALRSFDSAPGPAPAGPPA